MSCRRSAIIELHGSTQLAALIRFEKHLGGSSQPTEQVIKIKKLSSFFSDELPDTWNPRIPVYQTIVDRLVEALRTPAASADGRFQTV